MDRADIAEDVNPVGAPPPTRMNCHLMDRRAIALRHVLMVDATHARRRLEALRQADLLEYFAVTPSGQIFGVCVYTNRGGRNELVARTA